VRYQIFYITFQVLGAGLRLPQAYMYVAGQYMAWSECTHTCRSMIGRWAQASDVRIIDLCTTTLPTNVH